MSVNTAVKLYLQRTTFYQTRKGKVDQNSEVIITSFPSAVFRSLDTASPSSSVDHMHAVVHIQGYIENHAKGSRIWQMLVAVQVGA